MSETFSRRSFLQYGAGAVTASIMVHPAGPRPAVARRDSPPDFELEELTLVQLQGAMRAGAQHRSICAAYLRASRG
jgi:hypothetical protein